MSIDVRTLLVSHTVVSLTLAVLMFAFWREHRSTPGLGHWTLGTALMGVAVLGGALHLEIEVDLGPTPPPPIGPDLLHRLAAVAPAAGRRIAEGGDTDTPAHVLQHLTLELQRLSGSPVQFGSAAPAAGPGRYRVLVEFEEESVASACLAAARDLWLSLTGGPPFDPARLNELKELVHAKKSEIFSRYAGAP